MTLRVLDTGLRPARWNVAMSVALLEAVDGGEAPATIRFHRFPRACVIGRNQDVAVELDFDGCLTAGVEIARRITGGGAVVMGPGVLAFDLVVARNVRDVGAAGRRAGKALVEALRGLGHDAVLATPGSIEIGGAKVSGSAGRLGRGAVLHQATLVLDLGQTAPLSLLRRRTEGGRPTADPRHRVGQLRGSATRVPSPLAGEGGLRASEGRMRGRAPTFEVNPSSDPASPGHLLPQGEKEAAAIIEAIAKSFNLRPQPAVPTQSELSRAADILSNRVGRDDFVFGGEVMEEAA